MDKVAGHSPKRDLKRTLDERKTLRHRVVRGFQASLAQSLPSVSVNSKDEHSPVRLKRLRRAHETMSAVVGLLWPRDVKAPADPDAVSWRGAIEHLAEAGDQLTVTWRDEDHLDKYRHVADLAWAALCESGRPVLHRNGDPQGLSAEPQEEPW